MPPKRTAEGFLIPRSPKRFRAGSAMPVSRETSPVTLRPRSSSTSRAHPVNDKRMIPEENWKYGRNKFGAENTHIIVFEVPGSQFFARVFSLCNNVYWRCMGCRRFDNKATRAEFINGNLYVPTPSFHRCQLKKYEDIQKEQAKNNIKFAGAITEVDDNEEPEEQPNVEIDILQFNHPSSEWLRDKCNQLGIQYSVAAYQRWATVSIDEITTTSLPEEVEAGSTTVFECLSMLFSGNKSFAAKIEKGLSKNFSSKYKILQKYKNRDFSKMARDNKFLDALVFADEANDFHLEFFARWFQCRLGIFEGNRWARFGNWSNSDNKTITVLLTKEQQNYRIVLSLE